MGYVVTICIILLNLLCVLLRKRSNIISVLSFIWMFILFYGNTSNPDYSGYLWRYKAQTYYNSMEIGYTTISKLLHDHGMEYQYLILFLILLTVPFIMYIQKKIQGNTHIFIILYTVVFFTLDIIQIRNYVGVIIFTCAVIALSENKKVPYIILILVASLFHISFLLYIPFVFLSTKTEFSKKAVRIITICVVLLCILAFVNRSIIINPVSYVSAFIMGESEKNIYVGSYINYGFILYFFAVFVNILITSAINKRLLKNMITEQNGDKKEFSVINFSRMLYLLCSLSCVFMPLLMLNTNFLRLVRNECICIILLISLYFVSPNRNRRDHIPQLLVLIFAVIWFISIGTGRYFPEILENNFILGLGMGIGR